MTAQQSWHTIEIHCRNGTTEKIQVCNYCGKPMPIHRLKCSCDNSQTAEKELSQCK